VIPETGHAFDEAGLIAHCARRIAKFKVPERALPIDAFPVTPSANGNKIQKAKLREIALAALNR
jgi:fatty-acyl-CoA synthase